LRSLPTANPNYFFWSGNGDPETAKKGWQRALRRLFKRAKIKKPDGPPMGVMVRPAAFGFDDQSAIL